MLYIFSLDIFRIVQHLSHWLSLKSWRKQIKRTLLSTAVWHCSHVPSVTGPGARATLSHCNDAVCILKKAGKAKHNVNIICLFLLFNLIGKLVVAGNIFPLRHPACWSAWAAWPGKKQANKSFLTCLKMQLKKAIKVFLQTTTDESATSRLLCLSVNILNAFLNQWFCL